ncbi:MAG TPA: ATP-binding cassette domain-containing protein [Bacilli bacterium]|nr:ATP-binding cassette domain-containing protein [Bacilli bacterium]
MLELKKISRYYEQKNGPTVKALDNVSLKFADKGMVFVLGKSGSGKSTLLNVIGGLDKYTAGELLISGKSTLDFKQSEFDSYRNTMVGFIFQEYNVLDDFTVSQNIGIALELQGKKVTEQAINEMLDLFELSGLGSRKPNTLSGGQKQRVAIARALVKNPDIIMADEPTGALDSETGKQLFKTLAKLAQERLVIVVSHDRDFAETYGDRIIEFQDGKIIRDVTKVAVQEKGEENLTFTTEGIKVRPKYTLTAKDLDAINEYLRQKENNELLITTGSDHAFIETVAPKETKPRKEVTFIKSRLPFLSSLKMGTSALKHKKVRLAFSIVLASLSFSMFGISDTMAAFDKRTAMIDSLIDTDVEYAAIVKQAGLNSYNDVSLNDEDISLLNNVDSAFNFVPLLDFDFHLSSNFVENVRDEHAFYHLVPEAALQLNLGDFNRFGFRLLENSRFPATVDEIMITNYTFGQFEKLGYKDYVTNATFLITKPNDMLGKKIYVSEDESYTVVGVVDTGFDKEDYAEFLEITQFHDFEDYKMYLNFQDDLKYSPHNVIFINETKKDALIAENTRYQVLPDHAIYYSETEVEGDNTYEYILEINRFSAFSEREDIVFLENKQINELGTRDVIAHYSYFYNRSENDFYYVYSDFLDEVTNIYINDATKHPIILNYMADKYGELIIDIENQIEYFAGYYVYDLLGNFDIPPLYLTNKYEPERPGKYYVEEIFKPILIETYGGEKALIKTTKGPMSKEEVISLEQYNIVGISLDLLSSYNNYGLSFFHSDTLDEFPIYLNSGYDFAISKMTTERGAIKKLVNLHFKLLKDDFNYRLVNEVAQTIDTVVEIFGIINKVLIGLAIGFAVFAALLLMNFITLSVIHKKQEIGILRAIGARGNDVATIFVMEATVIALVDFIISVVLVSLAVVGINNIIRNDIGLVITLLHFGIRQIALLLVVALVIAYLSSVIPVLRISKKRPIDAIRNT